VAQPITATAAPLNLQVTANGTLNLAAAIDTHGGTLTINSTSSTLFPQQQREHRRLDAVLGPVDHARRQRQLRLDGRRRGAR